MSNALIAGRRSTHKLTISAEVTILKIRQFNFNLTFTGLICKGNSRFWHSLLWALGTNGLKMSVLADCSTCFLKTINYKEVLKYVFGTNGLRIRQPTLVFQRSNFLWVPSFSLTTCRSQFLSICCLDSPVSSRQSTRSPFFPFSFYINKWATRKSSICFNNPLMVADCRALLKIIFLFYSLVTKSE